LLLEIAGLDELAIDQPARYIKETEQKEEEDAVKAEPIDRGRRKHSSVG
jgi:hypothetical protein